MTRGIRLTGFLALALLAALVVFLSADDTQAAPPPFDPNGVVCFENYESAAPCDGDTGPGVATDIRVKFCIAWNEDCSVRDAATVSSNSGGLVGFTPTEFTAPKGDTIPIGAIAGRLDSEAVLGLINAPCRNRIQVAFTMLNASINPADTISPREVGKTDVMQPLAVDANSNGIPDGAEKYPKFLAEFFAAGGTPIQPRARLFGISNIQGSWITLNFLLFEPGQTLEIGQTVVTFKPALGYSSVTVLQDPTSQAAPSAITDFCAPLFTGVISLGKTINNPCTPTRVEGANCPVTSDVAPDLKETTYPSFPCDPRSKFDDDGDGKINDGCPQFANDVESGAQCDNDTSEDTDGAINDGCPPFGDQSEGARLIGACSGGDEGGCTNRANPAAGGEYTFTTLALSQRDADGDGYENALDTCFDIFNPEWNPYSEDPEDDTDLDGLPNKCDPDPAKASPGSPGGCKSGLTGPDQDQDCFANRADNCPLVNQLKDPTKPPDNFPETNTNPPLAPDEDRDGIGDKCDPNPDTPNGEFIGYCLKFPLNVGAAAGPVVGTRDPKPALDCATAVPVPTTAITPPPTPTGGPDTSNTNNGINGGGDAGVGSLSPTATGFPLWAAALAGLGALGVISGFALFARLAPRRER